MCFTQTNNLSIFCACPKTLWATKGSVLNNLAGEFQDGPMAVTRVLLDAFSQTYSKNFRQKAEQKILKYLYFVPGETMSKVTAKGGTATEEISAIK